MLAAPKSKVTLSGVLLARLGRELVSTDTGKRAVVGFGRLGVGKGDGGGIDDVSGLGAHDGTDVGSLLKLPLSSRLPLILDLQN